MYWSMSRVSTEGVEQGVILDWPCVDAIRGNESKRIDSPQGDYLAEVRVSGETVEGVSG